MTSSKKVSLSEVNQSIDTPNNNRFWQNLKAFLGPGALVAVGKEEEPLKLLHLYFLMKESILKRIPTQ